VTRGFVWPDESWEDYGADEVPDPPQIEVELSENEVVAELLDANGDVIRRWLARPPIGFALPYD
jgi:hypothetical protein